MNKKPDYHEHDEFQTRTRKLAELRQLQIDPYPHKYTPTHTAHALNFEYENQPIGLSEDAAAGTTPFVKLAGRLVLFRSMGKNAFGHLQDETDRIQIMFNRDSTKLNGYQSDSDLPEANPYKVIEKKIDLGDIIGIEGHLFRTHKGELTVFVKELKLLSKTLLPLADKHSGLADKELRYRKRWLDLISHPEVAKLFRTRTKILEKIRQYFQENHFLEVETPILQSIYGGAEAKPFKTVLNALDQEMFLRISLEIPLKKLIVGGMNRIFEMGRVFRNEGIDRNHNPEFTLLEAYAAYWDYNDMMEFVENLFEKLAIELYGSTLVPHTPQEGAETIYLDMKAPWKRMSMKECIKVYGHLDADEMMHSYRENESLIEALSRLDAAGWNAVNFDEYVFLPVDGEYPPELGDFPPLAHYYFFEPRPLRLMRAWCKAKGFSLLKDGGHSLAGSDIRLAREHLCLRHYIVRSQAHAFVKYVTRKFAAEELARGWHDPRPNHTASSFRFPPTSALKRLARVQDRKFDRSDPWHMHYWQLGNDAQG